jgi:selenocysteine lyase/cysteine desulfurase
MTMDRKTFLRGAGLGALGVLSLPRLLAETAPAIAPMALPAYTAAGDTAFWRAVRAQFPIAEDFHYFNSGGLGAAPSPVLKVWHDTTMLNQVHPATGHELFEDARKVVARFMGADASEICFTRNATEGNSIIAGGLVLREGDEVIFDSHAHPGGSGPWYNQHNRRGVVVRLFEPDPESVEGNLQRIRALITPRTKVIQISHMTAPTGILLPAAEIAAIAREHGLWFHIDGAQTAGMFPFTMRELGCDSYATSGHKWLGAPHETGILFIRKERNDEVIPIACGSYSGNIPSILPGYLEKGSMTYVKDATRHEYATRSAANVVAVAAAVEFHEQVGHERIARHGRALAQQLRAGLEKIPTVEVLTPNRPELCASITTFRTSKIVFGQLFGDCWKQQFRLRPVSEQGLDANRVSTHLFNSSAEVEALVRVVSDLVRRA